MKTAERSEKLTRLIGELLDSMTGGYDPGICGEAEILETSPTSIVARWKAQFLLDEDERLLPGLSIPERLCFEEKTMKLEWPTEEDCASLSGGCGFRWIREELDAEEDMKWGDTRISDDTIAAAMEHFDEENKAELLLDYFGNAKDIRYELYPKRLRLHIRRFAVAASRAEASSTDR
jgi:hypothetical protein